MIESTGELWEPVSFNAGKELTERLWVQVSAGVGSGSGWLYRTIAYGFNGSVSVALSFVEFK